MNFLKRKKLKDKSNKIWT